MKRSFLSVRSPLLGQAMRAVATRSPHNWIAACLLTAALQACPAACKVSAQTPPIAPGTPIPTGEPPADQIPTQLFPVDDETTEKEAEAENAEPQLELTAEQKLQIERSIESLGSRGFAERERVALELMEIGPAVLPQLREAANNSVDPEVRFRANQIVEQLTRGDMEARISKFLAGKDVGFPGWRIAETVLGDSIGVRQLYVELLLEYPELPASLDGETRDRVIALEKAITKVQRRLLVERVMPTSADAFALLLPTADKMVPINKSFEDLMLSLLDKETANKIRKDAQLSGPFQMLLSHWIPRSSLSSREEVLLFGMRWELQRPTLGLAIQTLGEATQIETLAIALQSIAKFGGPPQTEVVQSLLDDQRLASDGGFTDDGMIETRLGDLAIATIAIINNISLEDIGFQNAKRHPTFEFIPRDIGFPAKDEEKRAEARAKIDKLIEARKQQMAPRRPR
ncbi:MAG: hypothetical protein ACR2NZ_09555 [Rubripirellula sp.]